MRNRCKSYPPPKKLLRREGKDVKGSSDSEDPSGFFLRRRPSRNRGNRATYHFPLVKEKPVVGLGTPRDAWCGWDLGDPDPSKPSTLPRTLSRARNITVATVIDRTGDPYKNNRRTTHPCMRDLHLRFIEDGAKDAGQVREIAGEVVQLQLFTAGTPWGRGEFRHRRWVYINSTSAELVDTHTGPF